MSEELLVTARNNTLIDPGLHIWTWEVAMYLFMGGLTAGIMILAALMTVRNKGQVAHYVPDVMGCLDPHRCLPDFDPADIVDISQWVFESCGVCRQAYDRTAVGRLVRALPKGDCFVGHSVRRGARNLHGHSA